MTTESEAATEREADLQTILRLMLKHNWSKLLATEYGVVFGGDDTSVPPIVRMREGGE